MTGDLYTAVSQRLDGSCVPGRPSRVTKFRVWTFFWTLSFPACEAKRGILLLQILKPLHERTESMLLCQHSSAKHNVAQQNRTTNNKNKKTKTKRPASQCACGSVPTLTGHSRRQEPDAASGEPFEEMCLQHRKWDARDAHLSISDLYMGSKQFCLLGCSDNFVWTPPIVRHQVNDL